MFHSRFAPLGAALLLFSAVPFSATPAEPVADTAALREELRRLKADYEQRIQSLEARLSKAENAAADAVVPAVTPAPLVPPSLGAEAGADRRQRAGTGFNPKISLILDGGYADYSSKADADVPGVLLGEETGFREAGLALGETELVLEANIDHSFHGWATFAIAPEGEIGVEEAYINTLALPAGLAVKFGRFFSDIGYQNRQHAHAWEFVDAPLVYRALLGNQLGDDGLQFRWLAPTDLFFELGTELLRGDGFPAGGEGRNGIKSATAFAHLGGDAGASGSWRLGLSHLRADANRRLSGDEDIGTSFDGKSDLTILDGVYKWVPNGNASLTNAVFQAEYFFRREHGDLLFDPDGSAEASRYDGDQQGFYVQGVYQFMPRWRVGLRYDRLMTDNRLGNPAPGTALGLLAEDGGDDPQRWSAMVDFSNSEFSRFRLQFSRDASRPDDELDEQIFLRYIFSLGAHPAHQF